MDHIDSIGLDPNNKPMARYWARSPDPILAQHQLNNTLILSTPFEILASVIGLVNSKYLDCWSLSAHEISTLYLPTMVGDTQGALPFSAI